MGRRTISNRWPKSASIEDHVASCDLCGVLWRRSQLVLDGRGMTVCPQHGSGADSFTLSMENQEAAEAWAQELASRPPRDRGGEYGPESIARDPLAIFGDAVVMQIDAELAVPDSSGRVTSYADTVSGITLTASTGLRFRLEDHTLGGNPVLSLGGDTSELVSPGGSPQQALPVTYWGLIRMDSFSAGDSMVRSQALANACTLATGLSGQTLTARSMAGSVPGPGPGNWMRVVASFSTTGTSITVADNMATGAAGAGTELNGIRFQRHATLEWSLHRFLVLSGIPTAEQLTEADGWIRSRSPGGVVIRL